MKSDVFILAAIVYSLACAFFTGKIAEQKLYPFAKWFIIGLLFGILAILAIGFYEKNPFPDDDK